VDPVDNFFGFFAETQEPPAIGRVEAPSLNTLVFRPAYDEHFDEVCEIVGRQPPLPPEPPFDE
jgi:hypothetical protein